MSNKIDLKYQLKDLEAERENIELDTDDYTEEYDEMLNEIDKIKIGSLEYETAFVLRQVDPIAYRCGLNDYVSCLDVTESKEYQELTEKIDDLEEQISELE